MRRRGVRLFASSRYEPRSRRATDLISLGVAITAVIFLEIVAQPPSNFEQALIDLASATAEFLSVIWQTSSDLLILWASVLIGAALMRHPFDVARDTVLAVAAGLGFAVVAFGVVDGSWPHVLDALTSASPPSSCPRCGSRCAPRS